MNLCPAQVVFGNSLLKNRVLKVLDLSNNGLGPKAAFAMSVALLGRMSALELLVMDGNPVGVAGGADVDRRFGTSRPNFETLSLGHIDVESADV